MHLNATYKNSWNRKQNKVCVTLDSELYRRKPVFTYAISRNVVGGFGEFGDVHLTKMRSICVVDPLSFKDAAVVVDFQRFTDCHLVEEIFDVNNVVTSAAIFYHCRRERCSSDHRRFLSEPGSARYFPHRHSQLSDLTIRLYSTTSLKSISLKWWLYQQMFKLSSDQFNSQDANHVISHSSFWLVSRLTADIYRYYDHKYVNIHRH